MPGGCNPGTDEANMATEKIKFAGYEDGQSMWRRENGEVLNEWEAAKEFGIGFGAGKEREAELIVEQVDEFGLKESEKTFGDDGEYRLEHEYINGCYCGSSIVKVK